MKDNERIWLDTADLEKALTAMAMLYRSYPPEARPAKRPARRPVKPAARRPVKKTAAATKRARKATSRKR